jgi:NAD-specific glutamate dehydrogenase
MRNYLLAVCSVILVSACSDTDQYETLEGDLSFKLIDFGSYYALADGLEDRVFDLIDSLNALPPSTLSEDEKEFMNTVNLLDKHNLLFLPSFNLKTEDGDYRIYLDTLQYNQISEYRRSDLVKENKKVRIKLKGYEIQPEGNTYFTLFRCKQLMAIDIIPGKTYWRK